jgi:nucleoside-diphosphate-sugar epimerase
MDRVEWVQGDIADADAVDRAVRIAQPGIVFHLASSYFNPPTLSPADHMAINALGILHLCEALARASAEGAERQARVVAAGSCAVYAGGRALREDAPMRPGSIFGISKAAAGMIADVYARHHGIQTVELRLFTPYGPWESARRLIPETILSALAGREVRIGHGAQQRDFVYMDDVVDAIMLAAEVPVNGPGLALNVGSGAGRPIRDVVSRILDLMGNPVTCSTGTRAPRVDEIWEISADISAAAEHLGWRPKVSFDEGLRRTIEWFREHQAIAHLLT